MTPDSPLKQMKVGPCHPKDLPALRKLLNEVFVQEREVTGDIFEYAPLMYTPENAENLRIVRHRGRIVGHAGILPRTIRWRGQTLRAGFVGGVCCRQSMRGRGVGTLAMRDAADHMARLGLDFGVLWTGSPGFYERLGWRTGGGLTRVSIAEAAGESPVVREIMPIDESPFGPDACHRLHEAAGRNEVIRTQEETATLLTTYYRGATLALEGGRPDGYFAHRDTDLGEIEGDAPTCIALLARAAEEGYRACPFPLHDPRLPAITEALPVQVTVQPLGMLLITGRESLVARICAESGASPEELGIGEDVSIEVLTARIFGQPDREPTDDPLPLDIHIGYLDRV